MGTSEYLVTYWLFSDIEGGYVDHEELITARTEAHAKKILQTRRPRARHIKVTNNE